MFVTFSYTIRIQKDNWGIVFINVKFGCVRVGGKQSGSF